MKKLLYLFSDNHEYECAVIFVMDVLLKDHTAL